MLSPAEAPARALRVLVAEDQSDVLEALNILLRSNGYEPELVASPAAALGALERGEYDAVLMDLNYRLDTTSGAEGLELIDRIQKMGRSMPVVVMTAWGSIDLAVQAMHRGACDFVEKPWDNRKLLSVLGEHIKRHGSEQRKRRAAEYELEDAARIQRRLLPATLPHLPGIEMAAELRPARLVGGDYYDAVLLGPERLALCVGDVAGKGMPAALLMANLQAAVKLNGASSSGPADLCSTLNRLVCENSTAERFITFFYAVLNTQEKTFTYCNAGHNAALLAGADGEVRRLRAEDAVLGHFPNWRYTDRTLPLRPGDRLVMFSDGVTEAENASGEQFGDDGVAAILQSNRDASADELRARILSAVSDHCGAEFQDDVVLLVLAVA
jgi:sigma-B regulation protein RsbU (phosphoserine phosphatase)